MPKKFLFLYSGIRNQSLLQIPVIKYFLMYTFAFYDIGIKY